MCLLSEYYISEGMKDMSPDLN